VHNLAGISVQLADTGFDWAERFDADARERMLTDPAEIARLDAHRDFASAVPTPDHFIPLLYLAGLAAAARDEAPRDGTGQDPDDATRVLVDGCAYGSLSRTAYTLGLDVPGAAGTGLAAEAPEGIPADGTNL
jgi:4,5-DOPA dioxygenase extradiol